jgi:hypothetical protein
VLGQRLEFARYIARTLSTRFRARCQLLRSRRVKREQDTTDLLATLRRWRYVGKRTETAISRGYVLVAAAVATDAVA